jgi:hypothetical protein
VEVEYDPSVTDPEGLAVAADRLLETACSIPGVLEEYGGPTFGEFLVAEPQTDGPPVAGSVSGRLVQNALQDLLDCPDLSLDDLEERTWQAIEQARECLGKLRKGMSPAAGWPAESELVLMCRRVAETAQNWADCSDLRETAAVFKELGQDCQRLLERIGGAAEPRYVLYDGDADQLASTTIYDNHQEAVEDASQVGDVIVVPLTMGGGVPAPGGSEAASACQYELDIDGPTLRAQRGLLVELVQHGGTQAPLEIDPGRRDLLEGLVNLTDAIADQAHDRHGIDCLL